MNGAIVNKSVPLAEAIDLDGFAVVPNILDTDQVAALIAALGQAGEGRSVRRRDSVYAIRNLLQVVPEVVALAASSALHSLVVPILGPDCFAVRGILFDKTPDANWNVVWHQDLSIAVQEKKDIAGFGPWSEKAGVIHVQPPTSLLARMLTVRLHLDECNEANGPLQVLPGSYRFGRLTPEEIGQWRRQVPAMTCPVPCGGALLMRPLLLHASSASKTARHRRVIHLEYAAEDLPDGLHWHSRTIRLNASNQGDN